VPAIFALVTPLAVPVKSTVHPGAVEMPPAGTVIVKVNAPAEIEPEMVPLKILEPDRAVTEPLIVVPDCDRVHVIRPGPEESSFGPEYEPDKFTPDCGVGVGLGLVALSPLDPQPQVKTATMAIATRLGSRTKGAGRLFSLK
jgi:hypothetical protein